MSTIKQLLVYYNVPYGNKRSVTNLTSSSLCPSPDAIIARPGHLRRQDPRVRHQIPPVSSARRSSHQAADPPRPQEQDLLPPLRPLLAVSGWPHLPLSHLHREICGQDGERTHYERGVWSLLALGAVQTFQKVGASAGMLHELLVTVVFFIFS